ncbi:MAG: penicillin-binding transpeptidase domain-containing protein, partial [Elusimicrobia bacterium]|nr:penicillin-binding transpeptidase domain-containing protein [Elusimicrobiota bacterium]
RVSAYIRRNAALGISNASVMLLNFRTMEVEAYIGSADFFNEYILGQVNGVLARRSPGSVMKPFIFALAADLGLIHPLTLLRDTPRYFGIFAPENSDRDFLGPVNATDALNKSRNIPAIELLLQVGADNLLDMFRKSGVRGLHNAEHYGGALAIGGFELTMEDIVRLYAMLANRGQLKELRFLRSDPIQISGYQLLSPEAAFLTLYMMKSNPRPDQRLRMSSRVDDLEVSWKTGTSYSFRDAWVAGVFGDYVLAVWIGSFDNSSAAQITARRVTAPLFFEIVNSVRAYKRTLSNIARDGQNNVITTYVCAVSGDLPNRYCRRQAKTYFIPGRSPIKLCDVHRPVFICRQTGLRSPRFDEQKHNVAVYEFWSSDILSIFNQAGITFRSPPAFLPGYSIDTLTHHGARPQIILPTRNVIYSIDTQRDERIPFQASTDPDASRVFWFVNDKFIGSNLPGQILMAQVDLGTYTVRAVDDLGRVSTTTLTVALRER